MKSEKNKNKKEKWIEISSRQYLIWACISTWKALNGIELLAY